MALKVITSDEDQTADACAVMGLAVVACLLQRLRKRNVRPSETYIRLIYLERQLLA